MIKKLLIAATIFLLLLTPAFAQSTGAREPQVRFEFQILKDITSSEGTAQYKIIITNTAKASYEIVFETTPKDWDFNFEPEIFSISGSTSKALLLNITPPNDIRIGSYDLEILARDSKLGTELGSSALKVSIDTDVTPLALKSTTPEEIGAGSTLPLEIELANEDIRIYNSIKLLVTSQLFEPAYQTEIVQLKPLESTVISKTLQVKPFLSPGPYTIYLYADSEGKRILEEAISVTVASKGVIDVQEAVTQNLFSEVHTLTLTNVGNAPYTSDYSVPVASFPSLFLKSDGKIQSFEGGKTVSWQLNLQPSDSKTASFAINYAPLYVGIMLLASLAFFGLIYLHRDISIEKRILSVHTEDGLKAFKIQIKLHNKTSKTFKNLPLYDYIPSPLKLIKKFGTLEPDIIKQEGSRTKLVWKIDQLSPKEERYLSYTVKSTISQISKLALQPATLNLQKKNKLQKITSNEILLSRGKR